MALYPLIRPLIFVLDAERAHRLTIRALKLVPPGDPPKPDRLLSIQVAGLHFPNPVGLAAGFDKDAEVPAQMLGLGFGFVEVGTLTPLPQAGNPRPRLFRLAEDRAVINRMGFNNRGMETARLRLAKRKSGGIVGVNIGANKDSVDRIADYVAGVRAMASVADYLTINISSPNTPGLRALQDKGALVELLEAVRAARGEADVPVFLKLAPDLERIDVDDVARIAIDRKLDGLIVANTTISRPGLISDHRGEAGGLSGAPLKGLALQRLRDFRSATGGALPLIAAGGIENGVDAFQRIRAGASLVQLYSALVYQGPTLAAAIAAELKRLLRRHGFERLSDAVGSATS
ncbi:quinone-dependent dihydroorotate dehydrogenase [Sphingosinicella rhizophila]|uniref:Dihydroorotate dehydrogenase (quinone) n=1 Tax=Sphingosinicella rhizophila TaxID=3050082 RepID=A0ABU3Q922_9SPHN|nr:quinone-dependent dihydroorotate dehydrogenase [Sphingosinicella sp. GR2756]MDT9599488.1 quinone-dependent dihydroorotate dehydrogenase [Sphingosinicella sp. GR2756]